MLVKKMLKFMVLLVMLVSMSSVSTTIMAEPVFATTAEATAAATNLGYAKISELSNRQAVYKKGSYYISRDVDGHNGGAWKRATSVARLGSKTTRDGTYNADLTVRIGD
jgi:filamentous hemagglutinin